MTAGTQYVYDGAAWQAANTPAAPLAPVVQDYTSSQNVAKPSGAIRVFAELIGAGAGGATNSSYTAGSGGDYMSAMLDAGALGDTEALTIGAGSTGSGSGGDTTFASLSARGGRGARDSGGATQDFNGYHPGTGGGMGTGVTSGTLTIENSDYGGGGGNKSTTAGGTGGMKAAAAGLLQAGNGGKNGANGSPPGGGGGGGATTGASGAARLTWYFE